MPAVHAGSWPRLLHGEVERCVLALGSNSVACLPGDRDGVRARGRRGNVARAVIVVVVVRIARGGAENCNQCYQCDKRQTAQPGAPAGSPREAAKTEDPGEQDSPGYGMTAFAVRSDDVDRV